MDYLHLLYHKGILQSNFVLISNDSTSQGHVISCPTDYVNLYGRRTKYDPIPTINSVKEIMINLKKYDCLIYLFIFLYFECIQT